MSVPIRAAWQARVVVVATARTTMVLVSSLHQHDGVLGHALENVRVQLIDANPPVKRPCWFVACGRMAPVPALQAIVGCVEDDVIRP